MSTTRDKIPKILVIDDEKDIRDLICKILDKNGYYAQSAENGKQGMIYQQKEKFDIIITDIFMPEKEGIETIIDLKKRYPDIKIIAISGGTRGGTADYLEMAKQFGADYSFHKPFNVNEVVKIVKEFFPDS